MKQQKLVQIRLDKLSHNQCIELSVEEYLKKGWRIVSYQTCPEGEDYSRDVVVLLEKEDK